LRFWLEELTPDQWYKSDPDLDARIQSRFRGLWDAAAAGGLANWVSGPDGALAYIIVTDQFPRNMFRGDARAFRTDRLAMQAAVRGIHYYWDMRIAEPQRQFFYLPLMHSEVQMDQDRCVRMFLTRMPETGGDNLQHARAHREIIRRFGRFPYRNDALGRKTTAEEQAFIEGGGYGAILQELTAKAA
jgi:uncharacterized protein (DUF924 family)